MSDRTTPPPNREERRRREFRPADKTEKDAHAGRPDQDVVHDVGAGSGGATESDGRVKHHEGQHLGNQPNS
jgi:hypothetical protein